jgi:hypothetical protein
MKINAPNGASGPHFTEFVSGKFATAALATPAQGPNVPCSCAYVSCSNDSASAARISDSAGATDEGIPLWGNMPLFVFCSNLNELYFGAAGSSTISYGIWR